MDRYWGQVAIAGFLAGMIGWVSTAAFAAPIAPPPAILLAQTQPLSAEQSLERLLTSPQIQPEWFDPSFLSQVPLEQIESVLLQIRTTLGAYQRLEPTENGYRLVFEKGTTGARISLTQQGQIIGLLFQPPQLTQISLEEVLAEVQALPGEASFLVVTDGVEQIAYEADRPLAVGSAFKLVVLQALRAQIEQGSHRWDEVVRLDPHWRSLPSGLIQDWPDETPLTLQTLATLMISLSDNTATDALIQIVGKADVEALTPHNRPFLTTREAFTLKDPQNRDALERYRSANLLGRRQILRTLRSSPLPDVSIFASGPQSLDIEWFFSSRELCQAMSSVADLSVMQVNPGLATPTDWQQIAFKGGSEPGVLNFTTQVIGQDGRTHCLVMTWNHDQAIDQDLLVALYQGALSALLNQP